MFASTILAGVDIRDSLRVPGQVDPSSAAPEPERGRVRGREDETRPCGHRDRLGRGVLRALDLLRPPPSARDDDRDRRPDRHRAAGGGCYAEQRPNARVEPGTLLRVTPATGSRVAIGSTITVVVAREPRWEAISQVEGTEDAAPEPITVPAGARLVLSTTDTSPLGLWGGTVRVDLSGDTEGSADVHAGETMVLADASDGERTIAVAVDVSGSAHWALAVEVSR